MAKKEIDDKPFDEGTKTKLELFQLYTREWLPVFLSGDQIYWSKIHLFDLFCGSGSDTTGCPGSPIRILQELKGCNHWLGRKEVDVSVHFSDIKAAKIERLQEKLEKQALYLEHVSYDIEPGDFDSRYKAALPTLRDKKTACLVFLDQYGISKVTDKVFGDLIACPHTDILFFISSSILHRLNDHPNVKRYLDVEKAENALEAHREVVRHFRSLIPTGTEYYLAPFSIRKGSNVYGVVFGSGHPYGLEKFLKVAWQSDQFNGEANFDINRDWIGRQQLCFGFEEAPAPMTKRDVFEAELREAILEGELDCERSIYLFCLSNGMTPSHAGPVISTLKKERLIDCSWRVPNMESLKASRPIARLSTKALAKR